MKLDQIVQQLAPGYLAARKQEVPQMVELLALGDLARLRVLSHSLKGSGASFGFPELSRFGASLERYANESDVTAFREELNRLKDYLDHLECPRNDHDNAR